MKKASKLERYLVLLIFLLGSFYLLLLLAVKIIEEPTIVVAPYEKETGLLSVDGDVFIDGDGEEVYLRGMNLGQWLVLEGYLWGIGNTGGQNYIDQYSDARFRDQLDMTLESSPFTVTSFLQMYRDAYITVDDFAYMKELGINLVRIPMSAKDFPNFFQYGRTTSQDFTYLDRSLELCEQFQMYCLFDLHTTFAPQSTFLHADSEGEATFWKDERAQERTILLWKILAQRYGGNEYLAGFDLLNEPQAPKDTQLKNWYSDAIQELRSIGFQHLLFVQPNNVSLDIESILQPHDGVVYAPHYYGYGSKAKEETQPLFDAKQELKVPVIIGEVGNWANDWWAKHTDIYVLYRFIDQGIPVVYWTYKDMITDTKKSFGLVGGNLNSRFDYFSYSVQNGVQLPPDFAWESLANSFKTRVPTDRPLVEQIIKNTAPDALVIVYESSDAVREAIVGKDTDLFGYNSNYTRYLWGLSQEFEDCLGKTVQECFLQD